MDNKVGNKPLTTQEQEQLLTQLKAIVVKLREHGITLTTDDRKRVLRPRRGAEAHIQRVLELAKKYNLSLPNIPLAGMGDDLVIAKQFQPIEDELRAGLQLAEDTGIQADSEAWEAFLAYYGVLSSMAERMPDLAAEIKPIVEFMATGPRKKSSKS